MPGPVVVRKHSRFKPGPITPAMECIVTAEGHAINLAKRVETVSRLGRFSHIFLTRPIYARTPADFRRAFVRVDTPELKGIPLAPIIYEAKGVGHFDDKAFPVCPEFKEETDLELYDKIVSANPDEIWLLLDLAHKYFDDGDYGKAARYYSAVVEVDPSFAPAYAYLGRAYFRDYRLQPALAALERSLELDPEQARTNHYLAVCFRRKALMALYGAGADHEERARTLFEKSIQYHESACRIAEREGMDFPWARNGLIWTVAQCNECANISLPFDLDCALKQLDDVETKIKGSGDWQAKIHLTQHTRGFVRLQQGRVHDARKLLYEALKSLENRNKNQTVSIDAKGYAERKAELLFHIGRCMLFKDLGGRLGDAKKKWERAISVIKDAWKEEKAEDGKRAVEEQYWLRFRATTPVGEEITVEELAEKALKKSTNSTEATRQQRNAPIGKVRRRKRGRSRKPA